MPNLHIIFSVYKTKSKWYTQNKEGDLWHIFMERYWGIEVWYPGVDQRALAYLHR
jgi:hypothetical protein